MAAEALLSIARDEPVPSSYANDTTNNTTTSRPSSSSKRPTHLAPEHDRDERASSAPPQEPSRLFFPYIQAVVAFDTPYLGISPGVLAHGAEEHLSHASSAYKAYENASQIFGWGSPRSGSPAPIANASSRALPAADGSTGGGWSKWGKYAAFGGAAAAIAGAAGAAYLSRNQISQGLNWAGSHLEFVGVLAKGAELQKRVESVVELSKTHGVGFADFYVALGQKVTSQTKYSGSILGADRTFCVVPKATREPDSPIGTKRDLAGSERPAAKRRKGAEESELEGEMTDGEQVEEYALDTSKNKGHWVKCVNEVASDEITAHRSVFSPQKNNNYHTMVPLARDLIAGWIDQEWYESAGTDHPQQHKQQDQQQYPHPNTHRHPNTHQQQYPHQHRQYHDADTTAGAEAHLPR